MPGAEAPAPPRAAGKIVLRDFQEGDLRGVADLQAYVDQEMRLSPADFADLWTWLYRDNPMGPTAVVVATAEDGRIVGHEGVMPFRLVRHGEPLQAGISCNLVVSEDQRQTLLFPRIVRRLAQDYPASGFEAIYGPARPKIAQALMALGYREVGALPVYVRPFRFGPFAEKLIGNRALRALVGPFGAVGAKVLSAWKPARRRGVSVRRVEAISEALGAFAAAAAARYPVHAFRSREVMQWRYFGLAQRTYSVLETVEKGAVVGYVALRRMPMLGIDALGVVDLLYAEGREDVARALLRAAHDEALRTRAAAAACMVSEHSPLAPLLRRAGYVRAPEGFSMVVHEPRSGEPRLTGDDFRSWYATWYDHDYV